MSAPDTDPEKETVFISPELERELSRRARANGRTASEEASEIIETHVEESEEGIL